MSGCDCPEGMVCEACGKLGALTRLIREGYGDVTAGELYRALREQQLEERELRPQVPRLDHLGRPLEPGPDGFFTVQRERSGEDPQVTP